MELLNFMNTHEDWEQLLSQPPYCLTIKHDGEYVLLKYNQMLSDMTLEICLEARGAIFRQDSEGHWWCVSYGLKKFFNYNEVYSDLKNIDWNNCKVSEKVDGSNIRIYMDNGIWRVSTLGCIDAFKAEFENGLSYGDLVVKACGGNLENLTKQLQPGFCYIFELTGPNRIVINYGDTPYLWYLGRRNQVTFKENFDEVKFEGLTIFRPATFELKTLAACIHAIETMGGDEEGYVVTSIDKNGEPHRVKMKGAEYLRLHGLRCNGTLTVTKVLKMWRANELDDFVSAFPDYQEFVNSVFDGMNQLAEEIEYNYDEIIKTGGERKDLARVAYTYVPPTPGYVFQRLDDKVESGLDYLNTLNTTRLSSYLARFVKDKDHVGVVEDE